MRRRWPHALVLAAFLARVVLPAFHVHEEDGGECGHHGHETHGPALAQAEPACAICELLAVPADGAAPAEPRAADPSAAPQGERVPEAASTPRSVAFVLAGAPRGPPAPPSA